MMRGHIQKVRTNVRSEVLEYNRLSAHQLRNQQAHNLLSHRFQSESVDHRGVCVWGVIYSQIYKYNNI